MKREHLQFTKNDIWRLIGFILLVVGQFLSKENYSGFGVTFESNLLQLSGAMLLLFPFALKIYAAVNGKKEPKTPDIEG